MADKEKSLTEQMAELREMMQGQQEKPGKKFKLPISSRIQVGKVIKKEWVHVMMIRTNGSMVIKTCKIEDDTVKFGEYFYDARAGNILRWKKMPVLVLKEWNISPEAPPENHTLSLEKDYQKASQEGKLTAAQKLILTKLRLEAIKPKMQINFVMVIVGIAALIGGYFLLSYMGVV